MKMMDRYIDKNISQRNIPSRKTIRWSFGEILVSKNYYVFDGV